MMKRFWKRMAVFLFIGSLICTSGVIVSATRTTAYAASGTWQSNSMGYWYRYSDGNYPRNSWAKINGYWYHFNTSGYMDSGWKYIGGHYYYFGPWNDGAMRSGWKKISGSWYYFGGVDDGSMKYGWQKIGGKWYYLGAWNDGSMKTGWRKINGYWYYLGFADDGAMRTGWQQIAGVWYYFNQSGEMLTGWQTIGGKMYYFYSSGGMASDTIIDGRYVNKNGAYVLAADQVVADYKKHEVILPGKVVVAAGRQLQLHYDNILYGLDATTTQGCSVTNMTNNKRYAYITPGDATASDITCDFICERMASSVGNGSLSENINLTDLTKRFTLHTVRSTAGQGTTRRVMLIGDSITANGIHAQRLEQLFANDSMNIQLLGTLGMGGKTGDMHEGRGGWSALTYCTKSEYNGYTNAFWNPNTSSFDFSYYMQKNGYSGVDDVFITLGINDVSNGLSSAGIISYYNKIIASIRAYDPTVNIFIGLPIVPSQMTYADRTQTTAQQEKNRRLGMQKALIAEYDCREREGYFVVPFGITIDTLYDFPSEKRLVSANSSINIDYCTDSTHPLASGYYKMADMEYSYLKYVAELGR